MNDMLLQRQRWFRSFPEGTLEFLLVTRLASVFVLLALAVVREAQRPMALMFLAVMLLVDYLLMIWWAVQMGVDLNMLCGPAGGDPSAAAEGAGPGEGSLEGGGADRHEPRQSVALVAFLASLPALVTFMALTPWPELVFSNVAGRAAFTRAMLPVAGVLFVIALLIGYGALRRIRLGSPPWTALLLVPFLHWFAMHRLLVGMRVRLESYQRSHGEEPLEGPILAIPIADVAWFLTVVPWAVVAALRLVRGTWSSYFPPCGAVLAALFAVADVAAMEGVQRRFIAALRRQDLPPRP